MGFKDFLNSLFEESEEELLRDIDEAKQQIRYSEKKLRGLRRGNKSRKKKAPIPLKSKVIAIISILIILVSGYGFYKYKTTFNFKCYDKHSCEDCDIVAICPEFEELGNNSHILHFVLENGKEDVCLAYGEIDISKEEVLLYNETVKLGEVGSKERVHFRLPLELPTGKTTVIIKPICK